MFVNMVSVFLSSVKSLHGSGACLLTLRLHFSFSRSKLARLSYQQQWRKMESQPIRLQEPRLQSLPMERQPRPRLARRHRAPRPRPRCPPQRPPTWAWRRRRSKRRPRRWLPQDRRRSRLLASMAHERHRRAGSVLLSARHLHAVDRHGESRRPGRRRARGRTLELTPQEARPAHGRRHALPRGAAQLQEPLPRPTTTRLHHDPQPTTTRPHNNHHDLNTTTSGRRSTTPRIQSS